MTLDTGAVVSIAIFLLIQTGTLLYWAGGITQAVKAARDMTEALDRRVLRNETDAYETARKVATIEGELRK